MIKSGYFIVPSPSTALSNTQEQTAPYESINYNTDLTSSIAQLWKQDGNKLVNKQFPSWKYKDVEWSEIPLNVGDFGYLANKSDESQVLTIRHHAAHSGSPVELKPKLPFSSSIDRQKWIKGSVIQGKTNQGLVVKIRCPMMN